MKNKANILLSVVVVTKNNDKGLIRTLKSISVLHTSEIIVVSGDSRANFSEVIELLKNQNRSYKILKGPDNGIYFGMNRGLREAKGEFIWFLNAGDSAVNVRQAHQIVQMMQSFRISWIVGEISPKSTAEKYLSRRRLLGYKLGILPLPHQSSFMSKSLLDSFEGFDENLKIDADQELFFRALKDGHRPVQVNIVISKREKGGLGDTQEPGAFPKQVSIYAKKYGYLDSSLLKMSRALIRFYFKLRNHKVY